MSCRRIFLSCRRYPHTRQIGSQAQPQACQLAEIFENPGLRALSAQPLVPVASRDQTNRTVRGDLDVEIDGTAAHLAVLDIILLLQRAVDQYRDRFATVWTPDGFFAQLWHDMLCCVSRPEWTVELNDHSAIDDYATGRHR